MTTAPTYKMKDGPKAVEFHTYERTAEQAFRTLLDKNPAERTVQRFLESNPSFLPGAGTPGYSPVSLLHQILISQPPLHGFDARRPDFMWLAYNSDTWIPVLIEIERPSRKVFRKDGVPNAGFTQARDQLVQWRTWFNEPANQSKFQSDYALPQFPRRAMRLQMILIYGRRRELEEGSSLRVKRANLSIENDVALMSFDRLVPNRHLGNVVTVRAKGLGRYRALAVPPTMTLGTFSAERLLYIDQLEQAIDNSEGWSAERRSFVKSRLPYWRNWASREDKGFTGGEEE